MLARPALFGAILVGMLSDAAPAQESSFVRGDVNADGRLDLADPICSLRFLFRGAQDSCSVAVRQCPDAADANDDGDIDIADAVAILLLEFAGAGPLPEPFETCGADPTPDALGCVWHAGCNGSAGGGTIALGGSSIAVEGRGVAVYGTVAAIQSPGTYAVSGALADGQIVVSTPEGTSVNLILDGVDIHCSDGPAILVETSKGTATIVLAEGTHSRLSDGPSYTNLDSNDEPDATVFAKCDLVITGAGSLSIDANHNNALKSKDALVIRDGAIAVDSVDDGISGRDAVVVEGGTITVVSGGDGLKATNDENPAKGYIVIAGGALDIRSRADGLQAQTTLAVTGGEIAVRTAGGSATAIGAGETAKGLKAIQCVHIGEGAVSVDAADDAVHSNGSVVIEGGTLSLASADEGIHGDVDVELRGGEVTISKAKDGVKGGTVRIVDGMLSIVASADGVQGETAVAMTGGKVTAKTGGGSGRAVGANETAKGMKGASSLTIGGGEVSIDAADDALHSNATLVLSDGTFSLATADDAIHADTKVEIRGGTIDISKSYEGLESRNVIIDGGTIRLVSSDDGINTSDGSGATSGNWPLTVNGGRIVVYAGGDGVDANGPMVMTGGDLIVHGPTRNDNGALDYASFRITSGRVVAAGSSGMAQAPGGQSSTQYAVLVNFTAAQAANTLFHIRGADGVEVVTFRPSKTYQSVGFTSAALARNATYQVYTGGTHTGTATDGLYEGGTYSGGTLYKSFTISNLVTTVGGGGGRP